MKTRWQIRWGPGIVLSLGLLAVCAAPTPSPVPHTFEIGRTHFLLDGQPFQIRCGEVHAPRVPREYWRHRLQMTKAMGLNTVCAYLFWNLQEPRPGAFNWSGQADAAEFCRIAQQEGLWVILRPGPYACAEWEMGGLPWWLLKQDAIRLRSRDPRYLEPAKRYLAEVGRVLAPLQITRGGPILMVQVENEYGFYGDDAEYMGELRRTLIQAGFDVPLFACNPPYALRNGYRDDLFPVVNFGSDPAAAFKALRGILPEGPLMCGEFYPGWFDTWGSPHHYGKTDAYLADLQTMLEQGASFSIYMAHGGTSFGFWTGADRPFKPDTSSYDYDAPISEAGWTTDKFGKTRDLFARHLLPGESIPDPPARNPVLAIPAVAVAAFAPVFANLPEPVTEERPRTFEQYDQAYGCILYRTKLDAGPAAVLEAQAIHDIGYVFLDGQRIGVTDRRSNAYRVQVPEREKPATLDLLVEAMGRVNFGTEVHDRKGIHGPVRLGDQELTGWQIFNLPLDETQLGELRFTQTRPQGPAFFRATVEIAHPGDTFLDMRPWGKGYAWVNGHNLGRYWNIGPQQTMYVPAPWLNPGKNDILILDFLEPKASAHDSEGQVKQDDGAAPIAEIRAATRLVAALEHPILDQLRPELDLARSRRPAVQVHLDSATPVHVGTFAAGATLQEVRFAAPARGRYFCLESLNAQDGQPYAAVAELDLLDANGHPLNHEGWTVAYVDSEERVREDGTAENAIDGQTANFWHTEWGDAQPDHPHRLILDLGQSREVAGFRYVPRQGRGGGRIKDYRVFLGDDLVSNAP